MSVLIDDVGILRSASAFNLLQCAVLVEVCRENLASNRLVVAKGFPGEPQGLRDDWVRYWEFWCWETSLRNFTMETDKLSSNSSKQWRERVWASHLKLLLNLMDGNKKERNWRCRTKVTVESSSQPMMKQVLGWLTKGTCLAIVKAILTQLLRTQKHDQGYMVTQGKKRSQNMRIVED